MDYKETTPETKMKSLKNYLWGKHDRHLKHTCNCKKQRTPMNNTREEIRQTKKNYSKVMGEKQWWW